MNIQRDAIYKNATTPSLANALPWISAT